MRDPRITGISAITDRIVYIRHASPIEREIVAEKLAAGGGAAPDPAIADMVVAFEDDRRIGFAVLERSERDEGTACLTLFEDGKRRGIGGLVLQHLLEHSKMKTVLAGKDSARYLERAGFRRMRGRSAGRADGCVCADKRAKAMSRAIYERARLTHGSEAGLKEVDHGKRKG